MGKVIVVIGLLATLSGCSFQKKITRWLDKNASEYCAERFPSRELSDTVYEFVDSSVYYEMYQQAQAFSDSLLGIVTTPIGKDTVNLTSYKYITRTITKLKVDSARITYLTKALESAREEIAKKEQQIASRELTVTDLKNQIKKQTQYLFSVGGLFVASMVLGSRRMWKLLSNKVVK